MQKKSIIEADYMENNSSFIVTDLYDELKVAFNKAKNNVEGSEKELDTKLASIQDKLIDRQTEFVFKTKYSGGYYSLGRYMAYLKKLYDFAEKIKNLLESEQKFLHKTSKFIKFIDEFEKNITDYELYSNIQTISP